MGFGAPLIWTALSLLLVVLPKPAANCDGGLDCVGGVKAEAAQARTTMMRVIIGLSSVQPLCRALGRSFKRRLECCCPLACRVQLSAASVQQALFGARLGLCYLRWPVGRSK